MYRDETVKSIKILGPTKSTAYGDFDILGNINGKSINLSGSLSCDAFTSESDTLIFSKNLVPSTPLMLGNKNQPWHNIHVQKTDIVEANTYNLNVRNNAAIGNNTNQKSIIYINSADHTNNPDMQPVDYMNINSILKVGTETKKSLYINPYENITTINTNTFSLKNFTTGQTIISIDPSANMSIRALNYKLVCNTIEYPTLSAVNGVFNVGSSILVLSFDPNNIFNPYILNLNFQRPTFITFYNIQQIPINIQYGTTIYSLDTKLEFYFSLTTLILL